ncbi:MAG: hypothetical protein ACPG5B_05930 [Chitinophagales bacterium]
MKSKKNELLKSKATTKFQFRTPAAIQDFGQGSDEQNQLNALWSENLDGFIQQGMLSNRWNTTNTPSTTNYYNPVVDNPPSSAADIRWGAFPGRLAFNFPTATQDTINKMADTGVMPSDISDNPCQPDGSKSVPYYPYGPRGWQDEYCEWAVTRNAAGKITRIDFTCENPEYWNSLWEIDPSKVLELYRSILSKPQITLEDLSVTGITNPITGGPVYNPLNKWNSGTVSNETTGGAIHLTSTPNTIQTEIGLATASTIQRNNPDGTTFWPSSQFNPLLCFAQYGQKDRNSDPNIGGSVNNFVTNSFVLTLADPPGLYIQTPVFTNYATPDDTDPASFWTVLRGSDTLSTQDGTSLPGNFILHAVFQVPDDKDYVVGDITIEGKNIDWGSQVAATFHMQIVASAYTGTTPSGYGAVGETTPENTFAQPLQLFYKDYFEAMYNDKVANPVNYPIPLLSNSTYVPIKIETGTNNATMVVTCDTCTAVVGDSSTYPTVSFDNDNITAIVTAVKTDVYYAVPGNSTPSENTALYITVTVSENTPAGIYSVFVTNVGQEKGFALPALLKVIAATPTAEYETEETGEVAAIKVAAAAKTAAKAAKVAAKAAVKAAKAAKAVAKAAKIAAAEYKKDKK